MNTIVMIEKNRTQLVLQSENEHDKDVLAVLSALPNTHRDKFHATRGGWTSQERNTFYVYGASARENDREKDLVITFDTSVAVEPTR